MTRVKAVLSLIPLSKRLADIGCDHGRIGLAALQQGLAESIVFSDISPRSLDKAKRAAAGIKNAEFVVGDGFDAIAHPVDTAVISGLGGRTIVGIVARCPYRPTLILGAQSDLPYLREFLAGNGYRIERDIAVKEGRRYYVLMRAVAGEQTLSPTELQFGAEVTVPDAARKEYLLHIKQQLSRYKHVNYQKELDMVEEAIAWQK